ncbi:MAG: response regulator transcription factor [Cyanothece sp. SIO1E1]|nr:response regulator transcription factor [Cyanothece sp. SIO1E1]
MLSIEAAKTQVSIINLERILVVEDDELIRETIALALTGEGYEVSTAGDGQVALELICGSQNGPASQVPAIDLVILDLMLPYLNGLDLCRLIRHQNVRVPILMLSAKGSEMDRVVGLEVGADDYLAKPFGMRELIARCRALLRRHRENRNQPLDSVLHYQGITLYPEECRVLVQEQEVNLSPKEFRMLELFMSYPCRVWSREQLIDRIWGQDFMGDLKTVDVHIRWLREKLESDPSQPKYIITVRGFGYRFGSIETKPN